MNRDDRRAQKRKQEKRERVQRTGPAVPLCVWCNGTGFTVTGIVCRTCGGAPDCETDAQLQARLVERFG